MKNKMILGSLTIAAALVGVAAGVGGHFNYFKSGNVIEITEGIDKIEQDQHEDVANYITASMIEELEALMLLDTNFSYEYDDIREEVKIVSTKSTFATGETLEIGKTFEVQGVEFKTTEIANNLFNYEDIANVTSVTKLVINEEVRIIGAEAFENIFYSLNTLELPAGLKKIGNKAFSNLDINNDIELPNIVEIGDGAFRYNDITNVILGEKLVTIGSESFSGNKNIENISIPNGVETIGEEAFHNTKIKTIEIPNSVISMGIGALPDTLVDLTIGVETIEDNMFKDHENLEVVTITSGTKVIGSQAFSDIPTLRNVRLSNGLERIESNAFFGDNEIENIIFPSTLEYIGNCAFYGENELTNVVVPDTVKEVGVYLFGPSIKTMKIGATVIPTSFLGTTGGDYYELDTLEITEGTITIADSALKQVGITNLIIGDNVETIGDSAFQSILGEPQIKQLHLGNSIKEIGAFAFTYMEIDELILPASLEKIGQYGFRSNYGGLADLVIPKSVKEVGNYAFIYYGDLTKITIEGSFINDDKLSSIFSGETDSFSKKVFYDGNGNIITV